MSCGHCDAHVSFYKTTFSLSTCICGGLARGFSWGATERYLSYQHKQLPTWHTSFLFLKTFEFSPLGFLTGFITQGCPTLANLSNPPFSFSFISLLLFPCVILGMLEFSHSAMPNNCPYPLLPSAGLSLPLQIQVHQGTLLIERAFHAVRSSSLVLILCHPVCIWRSKAICWDGSWVGGQQEQERVWKGMKMSSHLCRERDNRGLSGSRSGWSSL